jgi:type I restriction enzyme S subunit
MRTALTKFDDVAENSVDCERKRFRQIFSLTKGLTITKADLKDVGIPCVNYGEIHSKYGFEVNPDKNKLKYVDEIYLRTAPNSLLKYGDFIFADTSEDIAGSGNFTYLNSHTNTFAGYHTIKARANEPMNYRYIAYYFDSCLYRSQIQSTVKGVKVYSITQSILKDTIIHLPNDTQQDQIVRYLDWKVSLINKLINAKRRQIALLQEQKRVVINEAVTNGKWEKRQLKQCVTICNGADYKHITVDYGGYPVLGSGGEFARATEFIYDKPSVLFGRKGTIDKPIYVDFPFWSVDTVFYTIVNKDVDVKYLYYVSSQIRFDYYLTSTAIPSMTQRDLGSERIPVPPLNIQHSIVTYLDGQCGRIDRLIDKLNNEIALFAEYRTRLISDAVTGKLDVRDVDVPEYESVLDTTHDEIIEEPGDSE